MALSYTLPFPSASPTHLLTMTAVMIGRMYSSPPVISNMITTRHTVIRVTPPSTAAAPPARRQHCPTKMSYTHTWMLTCANDGVDARCDTRGARRALVQQPAIHPPTQTHTHTPT
eukprot:1754540-Rhodomonas_salina.1